MYRRISISPSLYFAGPLVFSGDRAPPCCASSQYRPTVEAGEPHSCAAIFRIGPFVSRRNRCAFRQSGDSVRPPFHRPARSFSLWYTLEIRRFSVASASIWELPPCASAQNGRAGAPGAPSFLRLSVKGRESPPSPSLSPIRRLRANY